MDYMENWGSIESTFISDGRMLRERGMSGLWQPNWYLGTRFDYVYPPALRYGTAVLSQLLNVSTARSYHLYTATLYCLGFVGIYWLVRVGSGWRGWAWVAALATSVLSPTFLFIDAFYQDALPARLMPVRLGVLIRYGEGPHMSALALLGFALAAAWWGLRSGHVRALVLTAVFSALVVSNNFYGATALAIFFPILVWAVAIAECDAWVLARGTAIGALAYGLTAFWLTPSYLHVTLENMKLVSQPGHTWSIVLEIVVMAVFMALTWRLAKGRPERAWTVFAAGSFIRIALYVLGHHYIDFRTIGEPHRLCPEFDQFFIILAVTVMAWLWHKGWAPRIAIVALICVSLVPQKGWIRRSWQSFHPAKSYEHRIEYELTRWVHDNLPNSRVFVAGSVRFWFNAWFDLSQVSGGSDQGTLNPMATWAFSQIASSDSRESAMAWLLATGTDAVVINYPNSREYYHDFGPYTGKFDGLHVLYDNGRGDKIVRVPRKYPGLARIVREDEHRMLRPLKFDYDYEALSQYVTSIEERSPRPALWERLTPETMHVQASLEPGEAILIQETWDQGWQSPVPLSRDAFGFMLLDPGPGAHDITLTYTLPRENRIGRVITVLSMALGIFLVVRPRK
jgi:hypothetical protein